MAWATAFTIAVAGCRTPDGPRAGPGPGLRSPAVPVADVPPAAEAAPSPEDVVALAGVVTTNSGEPIVGRAFVTVDVTGERRDGVSGEGGAMALEEVAVPYDLVVGGDGTTGPTAFLGLTRGNPYVELFERSAATYVLPSQTLRLGVVAPSCGASPCVVDVASTSASGSGRASMTSPANADGDAVALLEVSHDWTSARTADGERISVEVLVHDAGSTIFAYARVEAIDPQPGGSVDLGMVGAARMKTVPVTIGLVAADTRGFGARAGGTWNEPAFDAATSDGSASAIVSSVVTFDAPGGGSFTVAAAASSTLTTQVPVIDGAAWRGEVSSTEGARTRQVRSGSGIPQGLPATAMSRAFADAFTDTKLLVLPGDVAVMRPFAGSSLSALGAGFTWRSPDAGALATIDVADVGRGVFLYRLVTNARDFDFVRLQALGLPALEPGEHVLTITTSPAMALDDALSADPALRRQRFDPRRRGATSAFATSFTAIR